MASKVIILFNLPYYTAIVPCAIFIYSVSFFIDDVITEVYGFSATTRAIKTAVKVNLIAMLLLFLVALVKGVGTHDPIHEIILGEYGITIRVFVVSFLSFSVSELINSFLLSRLKYRDYRNKARHNLSYNPLKNKKLIRRFLLSTGVGALLDSFIFCFGAFAFTNFSFRDIMMMVITQYVIKISYEIIACTFITSTLCVYIKKKEQIDVVSDISLQKGSIKEATNNYAYS